MESIDDDKKEPKKPTMMTAGGTSGAGANQALHNFEVEKQNVEKEIEKEKTFMLNLMYMARVENLTNDPRQLFALYRQ